MFPKLPEPECESDLDCPGSEVCFNRDCRDPCLVASPCPALAKCNTVRHRPTCTCADGSLTKPNKPHCDLRAESSKHL